MCEDFAARLRQAGQQYKSKFDEIDRHFNQFRTFTRTTRNAVRNSDDYKMLFLEEQNSFANQFLTPGQLLEQDLLKRLGPTYPDALYPPGDSRQRIISAAIQKMLKDGALVGVDPMSQIAAYLEALANSLP